MEVLYLIGAIKSFFDFGKYVQSNLLQVRYSSSITSLFQSFFLGLFLFLFLNFLFLQYLTPYFNFSWIDFIKWVLSFYGIVVIGIQFLKVRGFPEKVKKSAKIFQSYLLSEKILLFLLIIIWLSVSLLYVYENDALEYYGISRQIIQDNSLANYPPIDSSWSSSLYAPSTHPPYFHILFSFFAPSTGGFLAIRLLLLLMSIGMVTVLLRRDQYIFGFLVVAALPIFVFGIQGLAIESFRLPLFASGLVLILQQRGGEKIPNSFFRYAIGISMMVSTHSLGLLMSVLTIIGFFLTSRNFRSLVVQMMALLLSIACVAPQYISNMIRFGSPVQDSSPIQDLANIAFYDDLVVRRQISSLSDVLINGVFRPFIDFSLFGFIFAWGLILSLLYLLRNFRKLSRTPLESVSVIIILLFVFLQIVSGIFGVELLIKNVRYALSIFPCILVVILGRLKPRFHE